MFRRLVLVSMLGLAGLSGVAVAQSPDAAQTAEAREHAVNTATARRVLAKLVARESRRGDACQLDVSVVNVTIDPLGDNVTVSAEIRIAVSGGRGTLLQVFPGGAKVEIPGRSYRAYRLPRMREDALTGAVEAVFSKVKRTLQTRELTVAAR